MYLNDEFQFDEVTKLDIKLKEISNRSISIRENITMREVSRNNANIITANHTGYQYQSVYDDAKHIYDNEGRAINQLTRELQPIEREYSELYKERGLLYRELYQKECKRQYESETVEVNLEKIANLSNKINEKTVTLNKLYDELAPLEKIAIDQNDLQTGHNKCKAEYLALKRELEQAEAAIKLDTNLLHPIKLRKQVAEAKRKFEFTVKQLPTQVLLNSIENKREGLLENIASIKSILNELDIEWYTKCGLIAQIQYVKKVPEILAFVRTMVACDSMTNGKSNVGRDLLDRLQNKGFSLPVIFESNLSIFEGLLENLDKETANIKAEFTYKVEDPIL